MFAEIQSIAASIHISSPLFTSCIVKYHSAKHLGHITSSPTLSSPKLSPITTASVLADDLLLCWELKHWRKRIRHTETRYLLLEPDTVSWVEPVKLYFIFYRQFWRNLWQNFKYWKISNENQTYFNFKIILNGSWSLHVSCLHFSLCDGLRHECWAR